jgi:hypothetical protein
MTRLKRLPLASELSAAYTALQGFVMGGVDIHQGGQSRRFGRLVCRRTASRLRAHEHMRAHTMRSSAARRPLRLPRARHRVFAELAADEDADTAVAVIAVHAGK